MLKFNKNLFYTKIKFVLNINNAINKFRLTKFLQITIKLKFLLFFTIICVEKTIMHNFYKL